MTIQKIQRTQAERFSDFMADSLRHGPWIATGTVRRYLDDYAVEVAETVVFPRWRRDSAPMPDRSEPTRQGMYRRTDRANSSNSTDAETEAKAQRRDSARRALSRARFWAGDRHDAQDAAPAETAENEAE
jgi:hypothetical protein